MHTGLLVDQESYNVPPLKHKFEQPTQFSYNPNSYDLPDPLSSGFLSARSNLRASHPLEASERNYHRRQQQINNSVLLHAQGPAGPMIQAMEMRSVRQVGRLPFLPSSNFQYDVLTGRDMEIDYSDFLNTEEFKEVQAHPHVCMENLPQKFF